MKNVLIYYSFAYSFSGGDVLPLVFAEELQNTCRVTLAVDKASGVERSAKALGVKLDPNRTTVVQLMPANYVASRHNVFWSCYRSRRIKALAREADVCISATNLIDFGKPAHHFINLLHGVDPAFDYFTASGFNPPRKFVYRFKKALEDHVIRPVVGMRARAAIVHDSREHIYPNSVYVKGMMEKLYGEFRSTLFYPPTLFSPGEVTPRRCPLRVVCIGRITASKRLGDIIDIVERARDISKRNLELIIAGPHDPEAPYVQKISRMIAEKKWITLMGGVFGREKQELLLSGSFAVHARRDEEFGISVAEYLIAGLVAVVPDEGGACEVVGSPALSYASNESAAYILARLVSDDVFRENQQRHCTERAKLFSREAYMERQRKLLAGIVGVTT